MPNKPVLQGFLYTREEKTDWKKTYCVLYNDRICLFKKKPKGKPLKEVVLDSNLYVQTVRTAAGLRNRRHAFMLSDFTYKLYFSGLYTGKKKKKTNILEKEQAITDRWLLIFGERLHDVQEKTKWWVQTETELDTSEAEIQQEYNTKLQAFKESRGSADSKETQKEEEAAIAGVYVHQARKAANRASIRLMNTQNKLQELLAAERALQYEKKKKQEREELEAKQKAEEDAKRAAQLKEEEERLAAEEASRLEEEKQKQLEEEQQKKLEEEQQKQREEEELQQAKALALERKVEVQTTQTTPTEDDTKEETDFDEDVQETPEEEALRLKLESMQRIEDELRQAQEELDRAMEEERLALEKLKVAEELAIEADNRRIIEAQRMSVNPLAFDIEAERAKFQAELAKDSASSRNIVEEVKVLPKKVAVHQAARPSAKPKGALADRLKMWQSRVDNHVAGQSKNVFSGGYQGETRLKKGDEGYGKAVEGSKTDQRAKDAAAWVDKEIERMIGVINKLGEYDEEAGGVTITFGKLFIAYQDISDTLVGILMRAKKRKRVYYLGDMLYQGMSDSVKITVLA